MAGLYHVCAAAAHRREPGVSWGVAARHVGRLAGWAVGCVAAPLVLGAGFGGGGVLAGLGAALVASAALVVWLPRAAHAAFEAGRYGDAQRRYRVLAALAFSGRRERAASLSRAACDVASGRHAAAGRALARFADDTLDAAERVTWLNNRACVALDAGDDPHAALALADAAVALRPDVPAVQHTRAAALIAVGRLDDAIGVLDAMRGGGELAPTLEAMRCRELARAWERKGQLDYAADYRDRARLVAR